MAFSLQAIERGGNQAGDEIRLEVEHNIVQSISQLHSREFLS